jgi:hypothetical protein
VECGSESGGAEDARLKAEDIGKNFQLPTSNVRPPLELRTRALIPPRSSGSQIINLVSCSPVQPARITSCGQPPTFPRQTGFRCAPTPRRSVSSRPMPTCSFSVFIAAWSRHKLAVCVQGCTVNCQAGSLTHILKLRVRAIGSRSSVIGLQPSALVVIRVHPVPSLVKNWACHHGETVGYSHHASSR